MSDAADCTATTTSDIRQTKQKILPAASPPQTRTESAEKSCAAFSLSVPPSDRTATADIRQTAKFTAVMIFAMREKLTLPISAAKEGITHCASDRESIAWQSASAQMSGESIAAG